MQHTLRLALATATAAALTGGLLTLTAATATAADSTHVPQADFNGDGIGDVAFSAAGAHVSGKQTAGQVVALYGTATGVTSTKREVTRRSPHPAAAPSRRARPASRRPERRPSA